MSRRYANKVDANHAQIRDGLRACGFQVMDLSHLGDGVPDLAVLVAARRSLFLEVKDPSKPPSARQLTKAEETWMQFNGEHTRVVETLEGALSMISAYRRGI